MRINKLKHLGAMVLSAALSGNVLADLNDGLVAYYPFNGNAKDESGNGNDGTVHGATLTEDRFGNKESAYSFDGRSQILVNSFKNFHWGNKFTVSVWFKRTGEWANYQGIVSNGYGNYGSWEIRMGREDNGTNLGGGIITKNSEKTWDFVGLYAAQNQWHHVVMTYDGTNLYFYLNGKAQSGGGNDTGDIIAKNTPLTIGKAGVGMSREYFVGSIDDLRIYNRAFSESEIQQLYNAKEDEEEKPPIEISSKASYDSSTNTLSLEGILVPFIDEFTGKETDNKGIFDAQLAEKTKLVFELIPWSINFKNMFEGEETSGYILYHHKTRTVDIPCFEVTTIAKLGDGIEGKTIYYKDVTMKQRHINYPIFHVEDMTETDSCN
jgi:hypothetical protein